MLVVTNFVSKGNTIFLNDEPRNNQLSINNIDYYAYSVSPQFKRNKGAHSYVLALYPREDFFEREESIYVLIRTMINHSKKKRIRNMADVVKELRRIIDTL